MLGSKGFNPILVCANGLSKNRSTFVFPLMWNKFVGLKYPKNKNFNFYAE